MRFLYHISLDAKPYSFRHIRKFLWIPKCTYLSKEDGLGYEVHVHWLCRKTVVQRYITKFFKLPFSSDYYWEDIGIDESVIILPDERF